MHGEGHFNERCFCDVSAIDPQDETEDFHVSLLLTEKAIWGSNYLMEELITLEEQLVLAHSFSAI
jgi:hypothetical protein